jgi:hypothetical protein
VYESGIGQAALQKNRPGRLDEELHCRQRRNELLGFDSPADSLPGVQTPLERVGLIETLIAKL